MHGERAHALELDSPVDPARVGQQIPAPEKQRPSLMPPRQAQKAVSSAVAGAEKITFPLESVIIHGATLYPADRLQIITAPYLHKTISVAQLYELIAKINQLYFNDGYIFSRAFLPPQSIDRGEVHIQIIEGYVAQIEVQGLRPEFYPMRMALKNLSGLGVLNVGELERQMLLLNSLPGLTAKSVIEQADPQAGGALGGLKIKIAFESQKSPLTLSFDNYGSKFIGPYQFGQSGSFYNIFGYMSATNVRFFETTQIKELKYFSLDHEIPLNGDGTTLDLSANFSRVRPGYSLLPNDINAFSRQISLSLSQPVITSRSQSLNLKLQFERLNTYTKLLGTRLYEDLYYVLSSTLNFDAADRHRGVHQLSLIVRQGLDLFDTRPSGSTDLSRAEGQSDFTSYKLKYTHQHALPKNFALRATFSGQYASMPLLSGEEFGYGGNEMGKAYNTSEITGDKGIAAQIELNYTHLGTWAVTQPYIYYDIGKTWNNDRADNVTSSAASAGLGTRLNLTMGLSADFTLAKPLTRPIGTPFWGNPDDIQGRASLSYKVNY